MNRFWPILYNLVVLPILRIGIFIAAPFKRKIRRGIRGRRNLFQRLTSDISRLSASSKRVWFHSSSLGEFEQAKPIIAELKKRRPNTAVIVSFFSPSGYDHSRNYKLADLITYIPFDSQANARQFVALLKPDAAVMVRYDVWPNHIWALRRAGVPTFLANATLKLDSARHAPVARSLHRAVYNELDHILTVSDSDVRAFRIFRLNGPVLTAIGDTRYDQVWQRSADSRTRHVLPQDVTRGKHVIVIGSSWDSDEEVLIPAIARVAREHQKLLIILVPHEPTLENLERIERELNGHLTTIRLSDLHDYKRQQVIIIDSVGILMALYQYADISYVGGSFRQGVHNVLEPAVYGHPVVFGPVHHNSQEAEQLVLEGGAFVAANDHELYGHFQRLLTDAVLRKESGARALAFVERNTGATKRFLSYLEKVL